MMISSLWKNAVPNSESVCFLLENQFRDFCIGTVYMYSISHYLITIFYKKKWNGVYFHEIIQRRNDLYFLSEMFLIKLVPLNYN